MYTTNNKKHLNNQIDIEQYPPINLLVFDKLLDNRILFLSGPINSYISEVIKANLLYLDSISNKVLPQLGHEMYSVLVIRAPVAD